MEEEVKWISKRVHPRISWSFIVRFKLHSDKETLGWNVSVIKNISLGGCYFYSDIAYEPGQILDIEIQFPSLMRPMKFMGEVRRCEYQQDEKVKVFGIAVQFTDMDNAKKDKFTETITFFLKKQSKTKG